MACTNAAPDCAMKSTSSLPSARVISTWRMMALPLPPAAARTSRLVTTRRSSTLTWNTRFAEVSSAKWSRTVYAPFGTRASKPKARLPAVAVPWRPVENSACEVGVT